MFEMYTLCVYVIDVYKIYVYRSIFYDPNKAGV